MIDQHLSDSYRAASYIVDAPDGPITIRVDQPNAGLDELLSASGVTEWAFVTAWNPGSMHLPPAENQRNNSDLLERATSQGYTALTGIGVGDDGEWPPEPSFLILGIPLVAAVELGRFYRQRAIIAGSYGEAPELVWC